MRFTPFFALASSFLPGTLAVPSTNHGPDKHDISKTSAKSIIRALNLEPNVEKGYYTQTYISPQLLAGTNRSISTAIYYLLEGSDNWSYWHKVDAPEIWHYYAGAPLLLDLSWNNGSKTERRRLGPDVLKGERPQVLIEKEQWQHAKSLGSWTLVGTTMAPAFSVDGFEMHDEEGWEPEGARA